MKGQIPTINASDADSIQDFSYVQAKPGEMLGQALGRYMNELRVDSAMLSALTGISRGSIYFYIRNKHKIEFNHIAAICIALRLFPLRSLYLFSPAHYYLSAQDKRDMLIYRYIYGCAFNQSYTLTDGVFHLDYDALLQGAVDLTSMPEYQEELRIRQQRAARLEILPKALKWLKEEYPDDFSIISDYYLSEEKKITLVYLAEKYGLTHQAMSKRMARARNKLKEFIILHENQE